MEVYWKEEDGLGGGIQGGGRRRWRTRRRMEVRGGGGLRGYGGTRRMHEALYCEDSICILYCTSYDHSIVVTL